MAQCVESVCEGCGHGIQSWDDGNPYWIDDSGDKHYAYHPDHENLSRCVGNDSPHLCLSCGKECEVDSRSPITACPSCKAEKLVDTWDIGGKPSPYCKKANFGVEPICVAIS